MGKFVDLERPLALLAALDAARSALRRDLHRGQGRKGDYGIHGKLGHIYLDGDGFLLCLTAKDERDQSSRRWSNVKRRLAFCCVTQDGDDEGCLHLDRLPTPAEAVLIREVLGIRKRKALTELGRARLRVQLEVARRSRQIGCVNSYDNSPSQGRFIARNDRAATTLPESEAA
jgi:hypothetical protein